MAGGQPQPRQQFIPGFGLADAHRGAQVGRFDKPGAFQGLGQAIQQLFRLLQFLGGHRLVWPLG